MAVAVALAAPTGRFKNATVTVSGGAASTAYGLTIKSGSGKSQVTVTTDGSGAATYSWVPHEAGAISVEIRPAGEINGTTTAAATASATSPAGF